MRLKGLLLLLALLLILTACTKKTETTSIIEELYGDEDLTQEPPSVPEGLKGVDDDFYAATTETHLEAAFHALITASPWKYADELDPTCFVAFFLYCHQDTLNEYAAGVSADELEGFVLEYFDVEREHIRQSSAYLADQNAYNLNELGGGGGASIKIVDAVQGPNKLTVSYHVLPAEASEQVLWCGRLAMEIKPGGGIRYISNEVWNDPADLEISLNGDYTLLLTSSKPMSQDAYIDFAECPDGKHILCGYQQADGDFVVERFRLSNGSSLHQTVLPGVSFGKLQRIAAPAHGDYDFFFVFDKLIVQTNCSSSSYELLDLPAAMWPADQPDAPRYDFDGNSWVWTNDDGLWLLGRDGGEPVSLMAAEALRELPAEYGGNILATNPRLLCGGGKVACALLSDGPGSAVSGVLVVDLSGGQTETHRANLPSPSTPVADRYLTLSREQGAARVLDATNGETRQLEAGGDFITADYETLITWRYDDAQQNFASYVATADNPSDTSRPLLSAIGDQGIVVEAATERYLILKSLRSPSFSIRIVPYKA